MSKYVIDDTTLINIANAIRTKTDITSSILVKDMANTIENISSSQIVDETKNIIFIDYDGTVMYSWNLSELQAATELPPNPTHDGLIAQGWNWTLEDLKSHNRDMVVGQLYITDNGATRIYIKLDNPNILSIGVSLGYTGTVRIDWGDSTDSEQYNTKLVHTYDSIGEYCISLYCDTGSFTLNRYMVSAYSNTTRISPASYGIEKINLGTNCAGISIYGLQGCNDIKSISVSRDTIDIRGYATTCPYLKGLVLPPTISYIARALPTMLNWLSIPNSVTTIEPYIGLRDLKKFTIPNSVETMSVYSIGGMNYVVDLYIPDHITTTPSLNQWYSLKYLHLPNNAIGDLGSFTDCYNLKDFTIPEGITSIPNGLTNCLSLENIVIPANVNSIGAYAFRYNTLIREYHFKSTTPPSLASTTVFSNISADAKIYVPYSEDHSILALYQSATNWASYIDYIEEEPES